MRDAAESHGMTWVYWEFASGLGVYDPVAHRFRGYWPLFSGVSANVSHAYSAIACLLVSG
jgi:hypothetical protein